MSGYEKAKIYAVFGEHDKMFEWLDRGFEQRDGDMIYINVLPEFDGLRADPRYKALARRMNLVPSRP